MSKVEKHMLEIGKKLPDLSLEDENNEMIRLHDHTGIPMVIYFYPKDDTPGCTAEACSFRDSYEDFMELGAVVYGISADSPASHKRFKEKHRLNFSLLTDRKKQAEKAFKVPRNLFGLLPGRVTFIVDREGKIAHHFNSALNPQKHIDESLKALKKL